MRRNKRPLPIPQHEFGFAPQAFNLIQETTTDGERLAHEPAQSEAAKTRADQAQAGLFCPAPTPLPARQAALMDSTRLRAGDVIRFDGKPCPVLRVNDCAAVVAVTRPPRQFTTLAGVTVRLQPKPSLVRISPNSETEILNR